MGVVRRKLLVHPTQIKNPVDLAHQMVAWDYLVEIKRIQELDLDNPPAAPSCVAPADVPLKSTESQFTNRLNRSFATQSPRKQTWHGSAEMSAKCRLCCKSRFAPMIKNSAGCRRAFRVKM